MHPNNSINAATSAFAELHVLVPVPGEAPDSYYYIAVPHFQDADHTSWAIYAALWPSGKRRDAEELFIGNDVDPLPEIQQYLSGKHPGGKVSGRVTQKSRTKPIDVDSVVLG